MAVKMLRRHGIDTTNALDVIWVPLYEIPLACKKAISKGDYDAVIALGAVIRGSTPTSIMCATR